MDNAEGVPEVRDNPDESRYEIREGSEVAFLEYSRQPYGTTLVHTEVPAAFQGRGHAAALVKFALESARARGERIIPVCPYVRTYLRRHPEYASLVQHAGGSSA